MCHVSKDVTFADLGTPARIWAIGSVHANARKLIDLHDKLLERFLPGDRIVYMGNVVGYGPQAKETVEEIVSFRRAILAVPNVRVSDLVFVRGAQEEMLSRILQLPFAPDAENTLSWMLNNGLAATLKSYGVSIADGIQASRAGVMELCKWAATIRTALRKHPGHETYFSNLRQAATTQAQIEAPMLFVNSGIDPKRPLHSQGDLLWWSGQRFHDMHTPYDRFSRVIRGYDPKHGGVYVNGVTATIDGGCGFGGELVAAGFDSQSKVFDFIRA